MSRTLRGQSALIIAVGIMLAAMAFNASAFAVLRRALFQPLALAEPDRLVHLALEPGVYHLLSNPSQFVAEIRRIEGLLADPTLFRDVTTVRFEQVFERDTVETLGWDLRPAIVGTNLQELLGVRPVLGRPFNDGDASTRPRAVAISEGLWQSHFGTDPEVVGSTVALPGSRPDVRWLIVGVMPLEFDFPAGTNVWIAGTPRPAGNPLPPGMPIYGRVAPGVSVEAAAARLPGVIVTPLVQHVRPQDATALAILMVASALVALLGWVQVGAFLVSRSADRGIEIAIRVALGSTRARVAWRTFTESLVLVAISWSVTLLVMPPLMQLLRWLLPPGLVDDESARLDWRLVAFTFLLAALATALLAWVPVRTAWQAATRPLLDGRLTAGRQPSGFGAQNRIFTLQVLVTTMCLYLSAVAVQSFHKIRSVDLGFDASDVLVIPVPPPRIPPAASASEARSHRAAHRQTVAGLVQRIGDLEGIVSVTSSSWWPLQRRTIVPLPIRVEADRSEQKIEVLHGTIGPGYPAVLDLEILAGREPTPEEMRGLPQDVQALALITESLAAKLAPFGPPVGQILLDRQQRYRVAGVVADMNVVRPDEPPHPLMLLYLPPEMPESYILAKALPQASGAAAGIRTLVVDQWGTRAPSHPTRLEDAVQLASAEYGGRVAILAGAASLALALTAVGLGSAVRYEINLRQREFAVLLAVGASPGHIRRSILTGVLKRTAAGASAGVIVGIVLVRLMAPYLFQVQPIEVSAILLICSGILVAVVVAAWQFSRSIGALEPAVLLRNA